MTSSASDGHIDRLVKARWLAIGPSQGDLAEILDAAFEAPVKAKGATDNAGVDRLIDAAEALDIPADRLRELGGLPGRSGAENCRAFRLDAFPARFALVAGVCLLRDQRTKLMFVHLAEQIAKRQANRIGDAS